MTPILLLATVASAPLCGEPSHDRLIVQAGRDVCGAPLSAGGTPRVPGFMPTRCIDPKAEYRIDARRSEDRCIVQTGENG